MDESQEAIDHYAAEDARIAANDFRAHTCGECAWVTKGVLPYCRRVSWNCIPTRNDVQYSGHGLLDPKEPACPAYVPREAQP